MVLSLERFSGKLAVVTGASAGIGAAISEELVKNGIIVAGLARRVEHVEELANKLGKEKGKLHSFKCDMTKEEDIVATIKEVAEELGPISILLNNAGVSHATTLINGETEKWKSTLDTNILGLCIATREVIQNMKTNSIQGHVIHINSVLGHVVADIPDINVYGATKYAITALAETLRNEIKREKLPIKVTSISPGYVKTEFAEQAGYESWLQLPGLNASDVADAVVYALSTAPHVDVQEITVQVIQQ